MNKNLIKLRNKTFRNSSQFLFFPPLLTDKYNLTLRLKILKGKALIKVLTTLL